MSKPKTDSCLREKFVDTRKIMRRHSCAWLMLAVLLAAGCRSLTPLPAGTEDDIGVRTIETTDVHAEIQSVNTKQHARKMKRIAALVYEGKDEQAERALRDLEKRYPKSIDAHLNLGLLLARTERREQAMEEFHHVLDIDPDNAVAHNQTGILHRLNRNLSAAEAAYIRAIESAPDYALPHLNLAILYDVYMQKKTPALEHYLRYQALNRTDDALTRSWVSDLRQQIREKDITP